MTTAVFTSGLPAKALADKALSLSVRLWFATLVVGQGLFFFYIARFYGPSTLSGDFQAWRVNTNLIRGYVPGDTAGNLAFGAHVMMAAVVTFGGALQLVPQIRAKAPQVHRWIGRAFLVTAMGASVAGLYMTWARHTGNLVDSLAISLDAVLILAFAVLAWRTAMAGNFAAHRRWALRALMVANGVWFLRVVFAPWILVVLALGGHPSMKSPFYLFWAFGCYLVPLAVLELYFRTQARPDPRGRLAMAGGLTLVTALMGVGIAASWTAFFAPVLAKL